MAALCAFYLKLKGLSLKGNNMRLLLLRGGVGTLALTTYFYSIQHMPLASAVSIQYLSPILTLIGAHFLLKEKTPLQQALYFFLAFIGVFLIKGVDPRVTFFEMGVSLVSVFASALAYNLVRMLREQDHELVVVLYFSLVTIGVVGPFAFTHWVWPGVKDWFFIIVCIGVFTQMAQVLMTIAYQREPVSNVAIYNYLGIVIALGIGYYFFDEKFPFLSLVGMALILISVVMASRARRGT